MSSVPEPSPEVQAILTAAAEGRCTNCGVPLSLPKPAFCPACGQETRIASPTLSEFLQQFGGAYLSTEGALWRTLKLLLTRPGELTVQYLAGRRRHYVLPLRLYLTVSVVLLVLVQILGQATLVDGLDRPELREAERNALPVAVLNVHGRQIGFRHGAFVCEGLPRWLCHAVQERAAPDTRTFVQRLRQANERVFSHVGAIMFVLLPLFAGCLRLVHLRRSMPYTEHLVFALHLHAFWFIVLLAMHLLEAPWVWVGPAVMLIYALLAARRVYGGGWPLRLLRGAALVTMYTGLLALMVPMAWLLALLV
jgi:hypothetical protein